MQWSWQMTCYFALTLFSSFLTFVLAIPAEGPSAAHSPAFFFMSPG